MRVARRIVIPCRHKKNNCCLFTHLIPSGVSVGKTVAMSIQVNSASHPHRLPRQKRIALRPLRAELDKGCLWWNWSQHQCTSKKWYSWETTKGKERFSLFSFAISESQRKKCLVENLPGSTNDGYFFDHKSPQFHFTLKGKKTVGNAVFV